MSIYNLTSAQDAMTLTDLVTTIDTALGSNAMVGLFLVAVFFITVLSMKKSDIVKSITVASFISFVLSAIAAYGGLVDIVFPIIFLGMTAFGGLFLYVANR